MSKITFRADDDLVERIEALDASKSEVMREALRAYLDGGARTERTQSQEPEGRASADAPDRESEARERAPERSRFCGSTDATLDAILAERVDALVTERLRAHEARANERQQDVNVNVTLETDGAAGRAGAEAAPARERTPSDTSSDGRTAAAGDDAACSQCGETMDDGHVYCPNCGEKAARRLFCDCGDEIRSDWAFCPGCGRRTPSADVLDRA